MQVVDDRLLEIKQQLLLHILMYHIAKSRREVVHSHFRVWIFVTLVFLSIHKYSKECYTCAYAIEGYLRYTRTLSHSKESVLHQSKSLPEWF